MPFPILLFAIGAAAVAAAAASSSSSSGERRLIAIDLDALSKRKPVSGDAPPGFAEAEELMRVAEARGDAKRAEQEKVARAAVNKAYDGMTNALLASGYGTAIGAAFYVMGPVYKALYSYGIDVGKWVSSVLSKNEDWNSAEWRERARRAQFDVMDLGFMVYPPSEGTTDDFKSWAKSMEVQRDKIREVFAARADVAAAWRGLLSWVRSNPSNRAVLDVLSLRAGPWPAFPSSGDLRVDVTAKPALWVRQLAIPTLFAAMRGKDPTAARESVYRWIVEATKADPKLRLWENHHWLLAGIIDAADRATR